MEISVAKLRKLGACDEALGYVKTIIGDASIPVTESLCVEHATRCDWYWAAGKLLSPTTRAEYNRACGLALAEYDLARAEYNRACDLAYAEYDQARVLERA